MNLEPSSDKISNPSTGEALPIDIPHVVPSTAKQHVDDPGDPDYEGEELVLAKAPTLMLNLDQDLQQSAESPVKSEGVHAPRFYVQGIVMGHRACIITNLMGSTSQTVFQPQMVWTIGRNREAALPLRDRALSRRHAVILYTANEGFYLVDLNSMNGSFLNGVRVYQRQLLNDNDLIRMGNVEFNFFVSGQSRTIEPIHPEVLARFTNPTTHAEKFIDYSALEEPEILFSTLREGKS